MAVSISASASGLASTLMGVQPSGPRSDLLSRAAEAWGVFIGERYRERNRPGVASSGRTIPLAMLSSCRGETRERRPPPPADWQPARVGHIARSAAEATATLIVDDGRAVEGGGRSLAIGSGSEIG